MFKNLALFDALLLALVWFVLLPSPASAYFDLGTGTYLVQLLLAFLAMSWFSIKRVLVKDPKLPPPPKNDEGSQVASPEVKEDAE